MVVALPPFVYRLLGGQPRKAKKTSSSKKAFQEVSNPSEDGV
jgi:hypothetical protein